MMLTTSQQSFKTLSELQVTHCQYFIILAYRSILGRLPHVKELDYHLKIGFVPTELIAYLKTLENNSNQHSGLEDHIGNASSNSEKHILSILTELEDAILMSGKLRLI